MSWQLNVSAKQAVWKSPKCENMTNISHHCELTKGLPSSLLPSFPLVSVLYTCLPSSPALPHSSAFLCLSHRLFINLVCLWQQAVFAEQPSPSHHNCSTHQPLLTFDLDSPTCPLIHTSPVLLARPTFDVKSFSVQLINRYNSLNSLMSVHSCLAGVVW